MAKRYSEPPSGRSLDEFQWEQELRRDDRRIACYFRELPLCEDLPGEEEMIFDSMQSRPNLVSAGSDPGHWRMWDAPLFAGARDEWDESVPPRRKPGDEWLERLDKLQAEWNALFARELNGSLVEEGLAVSCAFGKVVVRLNDFLDTEEAELLPLKLCLGKRAVADLQDLCGMLFAVGELQGNLAGKTADLADALQYVREYLTGRLAELRRKNGASAS